LVEELDIGLSGYFGYWPSISRTR